MLNALYGVSLWPLSTQRSRSSARALLSRRFVRLLPRPDSKILFLENLHGISSTVKSDHILNLFQEVEGRLPDDRERMTAPIREFLAMQPEEQMVYMVGRRTGLFSRLADMKNPELLQHAEEICEAYHFTLDSAEAFVAEMMKRFI